MKKIVSIIMFLLVLMAFSGLASAYTISDQGSQTQYRDSTHKDVFSWYLLTLDKNAVGFQLKDQYKYKSNGIWKLKTIVMVNYSMAKTSGYSKLHTNEQVINKNGLLYKKDTYSTWKSTKTAYQLFKQEKTNIINKCKTDTKKYAK